MMNQTQLPPGLAMGIAAAQLEQQGQYKPFTSDGAPTVMNQKLSELSQMDAAKQAQTAAQIEAMKQAQMQQMLQQMVAQKASSMASDGIASLPGADVEMAEGGVVGYNGKTGSDVKTQAEEDREKIATVLRAIRDEALLPAGAAIADVATAIPRGIAGAYNSTVVRAMRAAGLPAGYLPDPTGGDFSSATPFYDRMIRGQSDSTKPTQAEPQASYDHEGRVGLASKPTAPVVQTQSAAASDAATNRQSALRQTPATDKGIAALVGPPVPSGSERQFGEALSVAGRVDPGKARTPEQIRAEIDAVYRARGIEPGKAERERIAKLEEFDAQEEAERKKRVEQRGMQDLITFLTGFGGASSMVAGGRRGSEASAQLQQGWERSDEAYNLLKRQRMDAIAAERVALANRNQALADGDIATAAKEAEAVRTAQNFRLQTEAKMRADIAVPMMQAETAAANRASTEMIHDKDRASRERLEGARLAQQAELNGQTKLANQINAANITVSSAIEKMDRDLEKTFGQSVKLFQLMSPEDIQKNPGLAASYQRYIRERENIYKTSVEPAINHRNRLAAQVMSGQDLSKWGEPQVKSGR